MTVAVRYFSAGSSIRRRRSFAIRFVRAQSDEATKDEFGVFAPQVVVNQLV
jgi:hypothetical protein